MAKLEKTMKSNIASTMTVEEICAKFQYYKDNYQVLLTDPNQKDIIVTNAINSFWPLGSYTLTLGQLLKLWFTGAWVFNGEYLLLPEHSIKGRQIKAMSHRDLLLFQICGNSLSGTNTCQAWSLSKQEVVSISIPGAAKYFLKHKNSSDDGLSAVQLASQLKK